MRPLVTILNAARQRTRRHAAMGAVLSTVVGAALFATIGAAGVSWAQEAPPATAAAWSPGPGHGHMDRMLDRILRSAQATDAQRTQIHDILRKAEDDVRASHQQNRELHQQALQVFTQPTVDARAAEDVRQKMLAEHDQDSKRMLQAMLDASAVLTPEQRQRIGEQMAKFRDRAERHHSGAMPPPTQ